MNWGTFEDACNVSFRNHSIDHALNDLNVNAEKETEIEVKMARSNPVGEERIGPARLGVAKLTKYELARIIGTRASQLANNDRPRCDVGGETDPVYIAQIEYSKNALPPYEVRRYHYDGTWERWKLDELLHSM